MASPVSKLPGGDTVSCVVCGKEIVGGKWFARLPHNSRPMVFCRPACLESYLDQKQQQRSDGGDWSDAA